MTSASAARGTQWSGRLRGALSWIALAVALGAIGGLFVATQKSYRDLLDRSNLSVAWTSAAFLSAVTPGLQGRSDPRFDPARLVSGAGALANASFFPGGLQVFFARTPLLTDTVGLAPVVEFDADDLSDWRVVVSPSGHHVGLVAFADRARETPVGWVGAWATLPPLAEPWLAVLLGTIAFLAALSLGIERYFGASRVIRDALALLAIVCAGGAGLELRSALQRTAAATTETHLQFARRLIEVAATADGVRSSVLPRLAPGLELQRTDRRAVREDSVTWRGVDPDLTGSLTAIRSRGGAFTLTGSVPTDEVARAELVLLGTWVVLLVALAIAAEAAPVASRRGGW
jgi:hypothetical protein